MIDSGLETSESTILLSFDQSTQVHSLPQPHQHILADTCQACPGNATAAAAAAAAVAVKKVRQN